MYLPENWFWIIFNPPKKLKYCFKEFEITVTMHLFLIVITDEISGLKRIFNKYFHQ